MPLRNAPRLIGPGRVDVLLADLDEPAVLGQYVQAQRIAAPVSELSTTSTPRPPVAARTAVGPAEVAGVEHVGRCPVPRR